MGEAWLNLDRQDGAPRVVAGPRASVRAPKRPPLCAAVAAGGPSGGAAPRSLPVGAAESEGADSS